MKSWLKQNLNWFAFILGFAYDLFSLHGRIGDLSFLSLIGYFCLFQMALVLRNFPHKYIQNTTPWLSFFCMGSLLSALCILYMRSSTLGVSLFAGSLFAAGLFLNEWKWSKNQKISIPLILNPLLSSAMLAFLLPHFTGSPHARWTWIAFALGGFLGLAQWLTPLLRAKIKGIPISFTLWGFFGLYILSGSFPSLPLVPQEFILAQHKNERFGGLCPKPRSILDKMTGPDTLDPRQDQEIYFFTSIYSPEQLSADLVQNWYYYQKDRWILIKSVEHQIHGGREKGFRLWGGILDPQKGLWKLEIGIPKYNPLISEKFWIGPHSNPSIPCKLP